MPRHSEENVVAKGKRTFQPNNRRRARVHGFRLRMRTRAGRAIVSEPASQGPSRADCLIATAGFWRCFPHVTA